MKPAAYIFNGGLFWPDGLHHTQIPKATPLYAGAPPPDPFEEWFLREYPLYRADRDTSLKEALRRAFKAGRQ